MAISYFTARFSKVGKGIPQVHLKDNDGNLLFEDDEKQKPKMGNEQYECPQLTDESISGDDPEAFLVDVMEVTGGDVSKAAKAFRKGWNDITRSETGGTDEYTKAARNILKLGLVEFKGKTEDEVIQWLKSRS